MSFNINHIRIRSWLQSVESKENEPIECHDFQVSDRPLKRLRFSKQVDRTYPTIPNTPPLSNDLFVRHAASPEASSNKAPSHNTGKTREMCDNKRRGGDELSDDANILDSEKIPEAGKILLPYPRSRSRSRSTSPKKSRAVLHLLEKPIAVITAATLKNLHQDIQSLYSDIQTAVEFKQGILPPELPNLVTALGRSPPPSWFRVMDPEDKNALPLAIATHDALCRIHNAAMKSAECQRHEQGWNNLVHTPLLDLVFPPDDDGDKIVAEFEPLMAATIAGDSIPRYSGAGLACSVSASSADESSEPADSQAGNLADLTQVHSSSNSKKVDYALVLHLPHGSDLLNLIQDLVKDVAIRNGESVPHINQSTYTPIAYTPIAVSIQTNPPFLSNDPLVQLGLWTAGWHKRMEHLRSHLVWSGQKAGEEQLLVSLPIIQVVGHYWDMYFACDKGKSIAVYGPVSLGSTESLMSIYALFTSLQTIKAWIETKYYDGLKSWFGM